MLFLIPILKLVAQRVITDKLAESVEAALASTKGTEQVRQLVKAHLDFANPEHHEFARLSSAEQNAAIQNAVQGSSDPSSPFYEPNA